MRIKLLKLAVLLFLCSISPAQAAGFKIDTAGTADQTLHDNDLRCSNGSGEVTSTGTITAAADQHGIDHKDDPDVKIEVVGTVRGSDGDPDFVSMPIRSVDGEREKSHTVS